MHVAKLIVAICAAVVLIALAGQHTLPGVEATTTKIIAQTEECFDEFVTPGGMISFEFEVTAGGQRDIDVTLRSTEYKHPADASHSVSMASAMEEQTPQVLEDWIKATQGMHTFHAPLPSTDHQHQQQQHSDDNNGGAHSVVEEPLPIKISACFDNKVARWTPKWVKFTFTKMEATNPDSTYDGQPSHDETHSALEHRLCDESMRIFEVRTKLQRLRSQEEKHRDMVESTNNWMMWGTVVNAAVLIVFSVFQYWHLKNFLAVRERVYKI